MISETVRFISLINKDQGDIIDPLPAVVMDVILNFLALHGQHAHWIIFSLLLLAGINIPISEDLLLIVSGLIAYTLPVEGALHLYFWVFLGCYLSAWEAYWLGRLLGTKLVGHRWFSRWLSWENVGRLQQFYARHGLWTFLIGRFIPFGVRNCLFFSSGLGHMPFGKFILRDGIACLIASGTVFSLAYAFGKNHELLYDYFRMYEWVIGCLLALGVVGLGAWRWRRSKTASAPELDN